MASKMLDDINKTAFKQHLHVANRLENKDWDLLKRVLEARLCALQKKMEKKQQMKSERLQMSHVHREMAGEVKAVVNLSTKMVDSAMQAVLNKGLNFAIAPSRTLLKKNCMWNVQ